VKNFSHYARIALGLASSSCVILVFLDLIGMIPSQTDHTFEARISVAEAMVTQATVSATLDDMAGLRSLLEISARRDDDVRSIGLRNTHGRVLMATRDHEQFWGDAPDEGSSSNYMRLPIFNEGERWATLEISFVPGSPRSLGVQLWERPSTRLVASMAVLGFLANFFFMKRVLRHLDPSEVVPARVQTALDVMSDGVLLVDVDERIVLANSAFCGYLNRKPASLLGMAASDLGWQLRDSGVGPDSYPWLDAIAHGEARQDVLLTVVPEDEEDAVEFRVSGSPVLDGWQRSKGAIVTFRDVTELERQRKDLEYALTELEKSRDEIRLQNEELEHLAQTDSLTGLANRRTFVTWYDEQFAIAHASGDPLSCLMVDIDFFKRVNDEHGHAMGDEIIRRVAEVLKAQTRPTDFAGRYGGEEFCAAFVGTDAAAATTIAERIRETIAAPGFAPIPVAVSIGVSSTEFGARSAAKLIEQADNGLYASKNRGRNRVTRHDEIEEGENARA
jgi:diguanylate cyclase (GGDEF)-like protein